MRFNKARLTLLLLLVFSSLIVSAQETSSASPERSHPLLAADLEGQRQWVDSIYNQMSLKEKVGQLFMVDVFSSQSASETKKIKQLIAEYRPGGVIFSKGGPVRQVKL